MNRSNECGSLRRDDLSCDPVETDNNKYTGLPALPADAAVTMAYVPFQTDRRVYDASTALCNGTLFPSLNKPFLGACKQ